LPSETVLSLPCERPLPGGDGGGKQGDPDSGAQVGNSAVRTRQGAGAEEGGVK